MHESLSPGGYRSIFIFQHVFVNLAVVVVQVCAQNSHDRLGSVCCEKNRKYLVSVVIKALLLNLGSHGAILPPYYMMGKPIKFNISKFGSIKNSVVFWTYNSCQKCNSIQLNSCGRNRTCRPAIPVLQLHEKYKLISNTSTFRAKAVRREVDEGPSLKTPKFCLYFSCTLSLANSNPQLSYLPTLAQTVQAH